LNFNRLRGVVKRAIDTLKGDREQNNPSEPSKVYEEVERRKQRAESLKIRELFEELYFHNIMYYPSWIQHSRADVPLQVASATKLDEKETINLNLNNRQRLIHLNQV